MSYIGKYSCFYGAYILVGETDKKQDVNKLYIVLEGD